MGKTSTLSFITTHCLQIQREGPGAEGAAAAGGALRGCGRAGSPVHRDWRLGGGPAPSPPLDFPANNRRGRVHCGAIPKPGSGRVRGVGRGLERTQGPVGRKPPGGAPARLPQHWRRQWSTQDLLPHPGSSLWGDQCLKSGSRDRLRQTGLPPPHSLEKGQGKGRRGAQPVAPDHCLLDSTGVGGEKRGASASSSPRVSSETQCNRQTGGKFT